MNLSEERNRQKLLDTLEALELTERNRKLAEEYFAAGTEEQPELLKKAELQDFYTLSQEKREKSSDYAEHLARRKRTEELARYVRFAAAVGGATACYLFSWYGEDIRSCLLPEQNAAIRAEGIAWNEYALTWRNVDSVWTEARKDLRTLRRAMELCSNHYDNAKTFLAAVYLNKKPQLAEKKKLIPSFFGKNFYDDFYAGTDSLEDKKVTEYLEESLADSLQAVFQTSGLTEKETGKLQDYIRRGDPYGGFPAELSALLRGKQAGQYLLTLLSGCAFLSQKHSRRFLAFLQVMAAANAGWTLDACKKLAGDEWFADHAAVLEKVLPLKPDVFVSWYLKNRVARGLRRMAKEHPECVRTAAEQASAEEYEYLMEQVRAGNEKLYRELGASFDSELQVKLAQELTAGLRNGQAQARQYLLGEAPLEDLYPYVNSWRGDSSYYFYGTWNRYEDLMKKGGPLCQRVMILKALQMSGSFFTNFFLLRARGNQAIDMGAFYEEKVGELVRVFEKEGLPIQYQADAMDGICSSFYSEAEKTLFVDAAVRALARRLSERREEFRQAAKDCTAIGRDICLRVLDEDWQQEKEAILSSAMDSSKQVQGTLALICAGHREWEPQMKAFLASRKAQERELAIRVLRAWGADQYREELQKALETEKSKKLKELLRDSLGAEAAEADGRGGTGQLTSVRELAAEILKGGKKRKAAWAYETPFSEVHKKDGSLAEEEYLQAILVSYADMSVSGVNPEALRLAAELEEKELGRYVQELFDKWLAAGAEAKKKWVLYAASIHGGEEIVPVFWKQIQEWPERSRGALAAEAVKALALNGGTTALLKVDQISRKFKFRQVKTAAGEALQSAAAALGISRAELEDRIVPDLGFNERMERVFDYGTRQFRVYLTPALELEILDGDGKRLKNMPSPGKRDDETRAAEAYAEFKALKKQLKTAVSNQKLRLEQALTAERLWSAEQWKSLFVKNPVMHQFAIGLIWGVYEDGRLKDTFRYMEDGSFNTREEDEFAFPEEGQIGLVHPIELSGEELAAWKEQLSDYEVTQPFEQLERQVYRVEEEEKGKTELTRFGGKLLNGLSLSGKLQGMGWYRGSVQDAGVYTTFYREDGELGAELEFSGCYVGDENEEVTVYGARFYKAGTVQRGSYVYDTIKKENEYTLEQISPRYFSEIVLQLTRASASSQEQLPYPECRQ